MTTAQMCALEITKPQKQQPLKEKSLSLQNLILKWCLRTIIFTFGVMQILRRQITEPNAIMQVLSLIQSRGSAKLTSTESGAQNNHNFNHCYPLNGHGPKSDINNQSERRCRTWCDYDQLSISVSSDRTETGTTLFFIFYIWKVEIFTACSQVWCHPKTL